MASCRLVSYMFNETALGWIECILIICICFYQAYLKYYNPDQRVASLMSADALNKVIEQFQNMAGINVTGELC